MNKKQWMEKKYQDWVEEREHYDNTRPMGDGEWVKLSDGREVWL